LNVSTSDPQGLQAQASGLTSFCFVFESPGHFSGITNYGTGNCSRIYFLGDVGTYKIGLPVCASQSLTVSCEQLARQVQECRRVSAETLPSCAAVTQIQSTWNFPEDLLSESFGPKT
jgi:hypothetical protein